ncbi:MAG: HdaA/DnaA family protein [Alphaproteobacteria bacterium]
MSAAGDGQLPLDLLHDPSFARSDLLIGEANREAIEIIDGWPEWPVRTVLLTGPAGCGKSHLAEIWRSKVGGEVVRAAALGEDLHDGLFARGALVVEDIHETLDEQALFHVLNRGGERAAFLVLTSRRLPAALNLRVADLRSRLQAARPVVIGPPNDALLRAILTKLFADRQLAITPAVVEYIVRRMDRSAEAARRLVDRLDRRALAQARAVTRPLAAEVLCEAPTNPND